MSKKLKISLLFIVVVALSLFGYNKIISSDQVVDRVNGNAIYQSDVVKEYNNMIDKENQPNLAFDKLDEGMKYNIVKSIVLGDLVEKKAIDSKVDEEKEYKKVLANAVKEIRQKVFLDKLISENITEVLLQDEYKKIVAMLENVQEIKAEQLLFEKEEDAVVAQKLALAGTTFTQIKADFDKKNIPVKFEERDYFTESEGSKQYADSVFVLATGDISKPFQTDFGWHLVKVTDKRNKEVPTFAEMQENIKSSLIEQFIGKYIDDLIKDNQVEFLLDKKENAEQK